MTKKKQKKPLNRSQIMARVKNKDTTIEISLRKALWSKGLRCRKNVRRIKGTPDMAFIGLKIAVFCDSEFWHGKQYIENGALPKNNREYWRGKFERNIARDKIVNQFLVEDGWIVLRFWEKDIRDDVEKVAKKIVEVVNMKKGI